MNVFYKIFTMAWAVQVMVGCNKKNLFGELSNYGEDVIRAWEVNNP